MRWRNATHARLRTRQWVVESLESRRLLTAAVVQEEYGELPIQFEANAGQTNSQVQYLARGSGYALFLTPDSAVLSLTQATASSTNPATPPAPVTGLNLMMNLIGANPNAAVVGEDQLPGTTNYFIGNDPSQWQTNIANYDKVAYQDIYPGINLVYYGNQQQLEYDYDVAPGGDPSNIRFAVQGAGSISLNGSGNLVLHSSSGDVIEHAPVLYQTIGGVRKAVTGRFVILGQDQVGFKVGAYNHNLSLTIDPTLSYSTYLGGAGTDQAWAITVDSSGDAYAAGLTLSANFPATAGAFQFNLGSSENVFVTKLNSTGTALVYSTYLGGNGTDGGNGIAVDGSGSAYVTGYASSTNFPTTAGAFQTANGGSSDAFVTKLNATGSALVYSTYVGGNGADGGNGIAVDASGNAYITGRADSTNFPTTSGAFQTSKAFSFVTKLNATGTALIYSTYLGGNSGDQGFAIAVDGSGNAYIAGETFSTNFPVTADAFQTIDKGENSFVTKLNQSGTALVYSTYLGGNGQDIGFGIAVDGSGNAYVTGCTTSDNFPTTTGAFQTSWGGGANHAFVTKLNATGTALLYSTLLGGNIEDWGTAIAIDGSGEAYVTGYTYSTTYPTTAGAFQTTLANAPGNSDAFLTKLNASGTALVYSTYLGGNNSDYGRGIAVDGSGNAYVAGYTSSTNFPTTAAAFQTTSGGGLDAFITKFAFTTSTTTTLTDNGSDPSNANQALSFTATVSGGVPDGESIILEDTSNNNAIVATGTLSSGSASLTIPAGTLGGGTHNLVAIYGGDANFAASQSAPLVQTVQAVVAGEDIFYFGSALDGNATTPSAADDNAIATNKSALLPGQTATSANFTNYASGINGIDVDINGLENPSALSAADFQFTVGNTATPSSWSAAPAPTAILVRPGAGASGSTRVEIVWANGAIIDEWIQVTVLADANTGLAKPFVFYFGNLAGDANYDGVVNIGDFQVLQNNYDLPGSWAQGDFTGDGTVNILDFVVLQNNYNDSLTLFTAPVQPSNDLALPAINAAQNLNPSATGSPGTTPTKTASPAVTQPHQPESRRVHGVDVPAIVAGSIKSNFIDLVKKG